MQAEAQVWEYAHVEEEAWGVCCVRVWRIHTCPECPVVYRLLTQKETWIRGHESCHYLADPDPKLS